MITEHDRVVLTAPVPEEFTALDGHTAAVATVEASQVRPIRSREITHARELAAG
jgi:hypothetical protein